MKVRKYKDFKINYLLYVTISSYSYRMLQSSVITSGNLLKYFYNLEVAEF